MDKPWQTVIDHLIRTAEMASVYASEFNAEEIGYVVGLLHDLGKYSKKFQQRLQGVEVSVDHSTAGAQEAMNLFGEGFGKILAYCIAGHHSGLLDYGSNASTEGTLFARLMKEIEDYSTYKSEIDISPISAIKGIPVRPIENNQGFTLSFFIRMVYSCLVDADFIDTETYISDEMKPRGLHDTIPQLNRRFNCFLSGFSCDDSKINDMRRNILERCLNMAIKNTGLYTLTVPTGGGKTYSSLAFALNHAAANNLKKIIYVIPYTSIIEQNSKVFKDVLGEKSILEHHSNYQFDESGSEEIRSINEKLKLASENWDIPIVVTTNVQFFESVFSNKSSKCRKIHNIAKSVIIFDEAQMLPAQYLRPCLLVISELVKNYGSTAVLCTATQPSISQVLPSSVKPEEIMDNPQKLYEDFRKVNVVNKGKMDDGTLADELNRLEQVLCIVNTRKHAREIFSRLENNAFHLSTLMCPRHRQETLAEIKNRLKGKLPCKVVSTQLIEAGVDVDFPAVYRSMAGIDSIIQSAGRCNREGHLLSGNTYVFKAVSEYAKVKGYLERTAKVSEMVFRKFSDPISLEAIDFYFKMLYDIEGEKALDKKSIISCFEQNYQQLEFDFQTASEKFKLIESNSYSIVIPYNNNAIQLIKEAQYSQYPRSVARKLQPYTVSIYENEYKILLKNTALKIINESFVILDDYEKYDKNTGLTIPIDTYGEAIFV